MVLVADTRQTEAGEIPADWSCKPLADIAYLETGLSKPKIVFGTGCPVVMVQNLYDSSSVKFSGLRRVEVTEQEISRYRMKPGDVLIGNASVKRSGIGYPSKFNGAPEDVIFAKYVYRATHLRGVCPQFLLYALRSPSCRQRVVAASQTGTLTNLNKAAVSSIQIPFPPEAEQEAIAEALFDADAFIESIEELIKKKRLIKQGAMQELLTGKKRLPGFESKPGTKQTEVGEIPVDWSLCLVSEVAWFQEGPGVRNYQFTTSGVKLFNGTNIEKGYVLLEKTSRHVSEREAYGKYRHFLADSGDIVIACSGITVDRFDEKVAVLGEEHLPLCMNTSTMRFKVGIGDVSKDYFRHFLRSRLFKQQIGGQATGSAQLNFGPSHVATVNLAVPPLVEQDAIARILTDMDAELEALDAKLSKARQIKQGMMHELLTGRIRLV